MPLRTWGCVLRIAVAAVAISAGQGCARGGDDSTAAGDSPPNGPASEAGGEAGAGADGPAGPTTEGGSTDEASAPAPDAESADSTAAPADGSAQDSQAPAPDAGDDSAQPHPDSGPTLDSAAPEDSSAMDATPTDTGRPDAANDASACSTGPSPTYQRSCTGCVINAACVLGCTSCTKKDQTQNANPSLQLPCSGTMSVANIDGVLTCQ